MSEPGVEPRQRRPQHQVVGSDEISIRDLYLTFRAGLVFIVIVSLACAVAALLVVNSRGTTYTTSATVSVSPPPVGTSALTGLDLSIPVGIDLETYRAIAFDSTTLGAVAMELNDHPVDPERLRSATIELMGQLELSPRPPASQLRGHVTVDHVVTSGPDVDELSMAAEIATTWATTTAAAVAELLTIPMDEALASLAEEITVRKVVFDEASGAWAEFLGIDERRSLNGRLDALTELDGAQRARVTELAGSVAAADARVEALGDALVQRDAPVDSASQLVDEQMVFWRGERSALQAELDHLMSVLAQTSVDAESLRGRLTDLEARAAALQRDLATASTDYYRVASALPTLQLQRRLVMDSARVTLSAPMSLLPEPRGRLVAVIASAAVGALIGTVLVFLRAAVREPGS